MRASGSRRVIHHLRFVEYLLTEQRTQETDGIQVYRPIEYLCELSLHPKESQTGSVAGLELDQHVHITVRREILSNDRTEEREASDSMPATEVGNRRLVNVNMAIHLVFQIHRTRRTILPGHRPRTSRTETVSPVDVTQIESVWADGRA